MAELEIETVRLGDNRTFPKKGQNVRIHYIMTVIQEVFSLQQERCIPVPRNETNPSNFRLALKMLFKGWNRQSGR